MAHLLPSTFLSLLLFFPLSSASSSHRRHDEDLVHEVCKASRDPSTCKSSLSKFNHMPPNASLTRVIDAAMQVSSENLDKSRFMVHDIFLNASSGNQNRTKAAKSCKQVLYYAYFRTNKARDALPQGKIKDARAWMSAALVYQYDCWSGLKKVNDTPLVVETMEFLNTSLMASTSNVLGMLVNFDIFGENTKSWHPPKTERDGVWEIGSDRDEKVGGFPSGLKANVSVCKSEDACDYKTVQRAVNAAPTKNIRGLGKWFVIHIKAGVYEETVRVPMGKKNVVFLGDGMGKTIITGSRNVGLQGLSTFKTATLGVLGDGFMASGLTIQNTAGPGAHQAVAFRSDSDLSILENCEFIGNQDTVYAHSLRQYYKSCRIHGNIDFIFGNSASFFHDCHILITPRQVDPEKGEDNAVTAHARTDPAQSTGFVFQNCVINGTDKYMNLYHRKPKVHNNFLGRPWKEYSRTVFIGCTLEALISPDGWMAWDGEFALKTLYYGEFHNTGPGSDTSKRVNWSSCIPEDRVRSYSVQNFIQGDHWISI